MATTTKTTAPTTTYATGDRVEVSTSPAGGWTPGIVRGTDPATGRARVHIPSMGVVGTPHPDKIRHADPIDDLGPICAAFVGLPIRTHAEPIGWSGSGAFGGDYDAEDDAR